MASEDAGEGVLSLSLPEEALSWLDEESSAQGVSREEFCRRLVIATRAATDGDAEPATVDAVDERVAEAESEFRTLLEDVRKRVVQVKRETDRKAPADHDHPELDDLPELTDRLETLETRLAELESTTERLDERLDAGFENYREILEYLLERTDRLADRSDVLAQATLDARETLTRAAGEAATRRALEDLLAEAQRHGTDRGSCAACGSTVLLGLLTEPTCPHCSATLTGVEPAGRLFNRYRLTVGDRPALAAAPEPIDDELAADLEDGRDAERPEVPDPGGERS